MNNVHFSRNSDEWETPQDLFDEYNERFYFNLDVCATNENAKCGNYITKEMNALNLDWGKISKGKSVWCNPPYSNVKEWIKKAYEETCKGVTTVMLIPARTDTKAWHDYIFNKVNVEVEFLKGRLKFSNSKNNAPFPSAIVIFNREK